MVSSRRDDEVEYLRRVEILAHAVVEEAAAEQWLEFGSAGQSAATPLRRAVNVMAPNCASPTGTGTAASTTDSDSGTVPGSDLTALGLLERW